MATHTHYRLEMSVVVLSPLMVGGISYKHNVQNTAAA